MVQTVFKCERCGVMHEAVAMAEICEESHMKPESLVVVDLVEPSDHAMFPAEISVMLVDDKRNSTARYGFSTRIRSKDDDG